MLKVTLLFLIGISTFVISTPVEELPKATSKTEAVVARRRLPPLQHEEVHDEFGQFALRYVTAEGTVVTQRGRLVPTPDGTSHVMIHEGEVSYIGDDGRTYTTRYSADMGGTHVQGEHLPAPPAPLPTA